MFDDFDDSAVSAQTGYATDYTDRADRADYDLELDEAASGEAAPLPTHNSPPPPLPDFLVPSLFPRQSISLLVGTSRVGLLRFILPQLENYARGLPFLNVPAHDPIHPPEQLGIIVCDRALGKVTSRIRLMGLERLVEPGVCPIEVWDCVAEADPEVEELDGRKSRGFPLDAAFERLTKRCRGGRPPSLLLVVGLQAPAPSAGKKAEPKIVNEYMSRLRDFCARNKCTILGTVGTAKPTYSQNYTTIPHKIFGSIQWAASAASLLCVEYCGKHRDYRRLSVQTGEGYEQQFGSSFYVRFSELEGRLELSDAPESPRTPSFVALDRMLEDCFEPGGDYTRADFVAQAKHLDISDSTVERWLTACVECLPPVLKRSESRTNRASYKVLQAN